MKRPLQELLSGNTSIDDTEMVDAPREDEGQEQEQEQEPEPVQEGLCVECGDQPAELTCHNCEEDFCIVCFDYIHRTGSRKLHKTTQFENAKQRDQPNGDDEEVDQAQQEDQDVSDDDVDDKEDEDDITHQRLVANVANTLIATKGEGNSDEKVLLGKVRESTRFVPMRLTHDERKLLRLLEAALNVSEYTDKIDILMYSSKAKRMIAQLKEMCAILSGLVVATDMREGQTLIQDKEFSSNAEWFQTVFEIGRRYKIMNPEKMRDSFGKLVYMIMDSRLPEVKEAMEFDLYKPINTVHSYLEQRDGLGVLDDPLVMYATVEIIPEGKSRPQIQREIKAKERAIESLANKHRTNLLKKEDIRQCLYSIGDYHAYLRANCHPVEQMLKMLEQRFDPDEMDANRDFALGISRGVGGARLSHNHFKQYHYVKQSLTLWSQIMNNMFMLWMLADNDLTSDKRRYALQDTGQGLQRVKDCPHVGRAMHGIIRKAQERTGKWIGSSVVHLGDRAVPNALIFLDKYLQVPRILNPVYSVLNKLDAQGNSDKYLRDWINAQFNSVDELKKFILADFFKHAFDGSGADNFYDAGSCIDGRLTSAWNWSNTIAKKPYYSKFLIAGFTGFDGSEGF